jgi:hypothetical protein
VAIPQASDTTKARISPKPIQIKPPKSKQNSLD